MTLANSTSFRATLAAILVAVTATLSRGQGAPLASGVPRAEEVRKLLATLQAADSSYEQKALACHRLAIIGTKDAIPVLATFLTDEKMAHYARHALEPMPDPAAGAALREALGRTQGKLLVGVVNSIGFRRDSAATPTLAKLLAAPDREVATAAAAALGRIGGTEAAKHLQATLGKAQGETRNALADACLACAEQLVAERKRSEAAAIYDAMTAPGFPDYLRTAAMYGAITSREAGGVALLVKQLHAQDKAMLSAAWRAARELPGAGVTKALAAEFAKFPADKQTALLHVLGDRTDSTALAVVLEGTKATAPAVRVAALQVLPRVDDGKSSLPVLLRAVTGGQSPAETDAALASLGQIGGADANASILAAMRSAAPALKVKLIALLATRRAENARADLLKLAAGPEAEVAKAALRALAVVARPEDLSELIRLSTSARDDSVKVPADLAVYSVSMKITPAAKRPEPVLTALRSAKDAPTRAALLRPLGAIIKGTGGSPQALETVKSALKDSDAQVRLAALRCLTDWPDASPAGLLLEVAQNEPDHRELALRGGARMAANVAAGRDSTKLDHLAWFTQANQLVRTTEEKLIIVSGLGSLRQIEGLRMLQPYLEDPAVATEAELAVVELSAALASTSHAGTVKGVLEKITATSKDADVRRKAGKAAKGIQPKKQK